jgi:hypothetical protein
LYLRPLFERRTVSSIEKPDVIEIPIRIEAIKLWIMLVGIVNLGLELDRKREGAVPGDGNQSEPALCH